MIGAGVQAECFGTPTFVETNMGPRYSNIGAAQALVRAGIKKLAIASPDSVAAYSDGGAVKVAQAAGIPVKTFPTQLPVTDATSQLLQMYQFVGDGGGILLNFTPDTAPAFMKAAIAQGLVSKVKWGSSTPIANTFMSEQFSPAFDGHLWINSEFGLLDASQGPDTRLMLAVQKKYAPKIAIGAFPQMGFMVGKFSVQALLNVKGPITAKSVQRGCPRAEEPALGHPLQAVVRGEQPAVPHPEQHGPHGRLQEQEGRVEGEVLRHRTGRQGARPRRESGRRSST